MKKGILCLSVSILPFSLQYAQYSLGLQSFPQTLEQKKIQSYKTFFQRDWVKKSVAPALLFTASTATWGERKNIRAIRNRYIPTFKVGYDNYLQYAPTVAVYGLKLAGVKGRNNLGRATLCYATSITIMGIIVNSLKYTTKVERPDGSSKNSFPSGHTAMAFTNASFLHKEYGLVNPAYSIGGYSAAVLTGLGRNLNNRHWISDVIAGAGIGIISTELGYFFIDKIYKNKGDNLGMLADIEGNENPSFLSLKIGSALPTTNFLKESELSDKKEVGFEVGIEGAYFFSKKWGVGGDCSFSSFPIKPARFSLDHDRGSFDMTTQSVGFLNFGVGPYFSHEISDQLNLVLKTTAGYSSGAGGKIFVKSESFDLPNDELMVVEYKPSRNFRWNSGAALTYKLNPELGVTVYADYNQTQSHISYRFNDALQNDQEMSDKLDNDLTHEKIKYVSLGLKLTAYF